MIGHQRMETESGSKNSQKLMASGK